MRSKLLRVLGLLVALGLFYLGIWGSPAVPNDGVLEALEQAKLVANAEELFSAKRYEESLPPLLALHGARPENLVYIGQLAIVYRKLKRPKEEAEILEKFIHLSPKPEDACPRIGLVYLELKLLSEATDAFERCVQFDSDDPDLMFHLGLRYERTGRADRAFELYTQGHNLDPKNGDLLLGLARLHLRKKEPNRAMELAQRALVRRAKAPAEPLFLLGVASRMLSDFTLSRAYLERGIAAKDSADFRVALALVSEVEKKLDEAAGHCERALELEPGHPDATRLLDRLKRKRK